MVRKSVMKIARKFIKEDEKLLRRLAEEHKYLKKNRNSRKTSKEAA